jgi:hypothetical protein
VVLLTCNLEIALSHQPPHGRFRPAIRSWVLTGDDQTRYMGYTWWPRCNSPHRRPFSVSKRPTPVHPASFESRRSERPV